MGNAQSRTNMSSSPADVIAPRDARPTVERENRRKEGEHEGVESTHKIHQEHPEKKGYKNSGQCHGALRSLHPPDQLHQIYAGCVKGYLADTETY